MTREEAICELRKMWIIAGVIGIAMGVVMIMDVGANMDIGSAIFTFIFVSVLFAFVLGGIPIGWRWAGSIITAVSITGIVIKGIIAIVLGWFALAYYTIKDVVIIVKEKQ